MTTKSPQYYSSNKLILALLWLSNKFGSGRGFSVEMLGAFAHLRPHKAEIAAERLRKRGILEYKDGLYKIRPERTSLSKKDGLPYETTRAMEIRDEKTKTTN